MKLQQQRATFNDFGAGEFLQGIQQNNPEVVFAAPANLNDPGWYPNYQTKLQLDVPIYNGGQIWSGLHQAEAMLGAARQGEELARQKLLFEVLHLYESTRSAQGYVKAARQGLQAAQSYLDLTNKLFKRGVVAKTDVLQAKVHLGDARLGLAEAEKQNAMAQEGLRIITGYPSSQPIRLVAENVALTLPSPDLKELKSQAVAANPGLRALDSRVLAAEAGVAQARAAYLPHFNIMLAREWNDKTVNLSHPSYTVAGVLSWDVLDLGSRGGVLDQAEAKVIKGRGALRQAQNQLRLKIERAWQDVRLAQTRIQVKQDAAAESAEAARLAQLRYEQGISTFTQLLSAQADLDKARADLVAAHYQQVMAQAGMLLAVGQLRPSAMRMTTIPSASD
jgi:outer membrane protein